MARERVTVWRVEDRMGRGPYRPDWETASKAKSQLVDEICEAHIDHRFHPLPYEDGITGLTESMVCGFATLDDLNAWFVGWHRKLNRASYWIVEYTVPPRDVKRGRLQVAFNKRFATVESRHHPH